MPVCRAPLPFPGFCLICKQYVARPARPLLARSLARVSGGGKGPRAERTKENVAIQGLAGSRSKFPRHFSGRIRHGTRVNGPQFDDCIPVVNSNGIGVCYILFAVTSKLECAASERNGGTRLERGSFAFSSRANVICSSARPLARPSPASRGPIPTTQRDRFIRFLKGFGSRTY